MPLFERENYSWGPQQLAYLYDHPKKREFKKAEPVASSAIKMAAGKPELSLSLLHSYRSRGIARRNLGNLDGAIQDFSQAVNLERDDEHKSDILTERAETYLMKEDFKSACKDLVWALKLDVDQSNHKALLLYQTRCLSQEDESPGAAEPKGSPPLATEDSMIPVEQGK
jgi:tetratricopeptide (TPR) repeat protein